MAGPMQRPNRDRNQYLNWGPEVRFRPPIHTR